MKHARTTSLKVLRLLTFAAICLTTTAYADEYGDVSQLLRANKFAEAMTKVDGFLAAKPADPQMRFLKGVTQRSLGKQTEAIDTFTKLTEDYPELPEPYNNLAVLYAGQGQYDKARVALEMAIRTNPSYATAHENIGDIYARLASQAYSKALQLDGSSAAVPPKLALIRELFKPAGTSKTTVAVAASAAPVVPAAPPAATKPVPAAVVATPKPTPPTAKPAAPVASTAVSVAKPAPESSDAKAAEAAVLAWAHAWENKDMPAYLKAYSPQFTPSGSESHSAWEKDRRARIMGKSHISLKITDLKLNVTGDKAVAKFRQAYKADALSVSSHKTLDLQKVNNHWLITRESTGN